MEKADLWSLFIMKVPLCEVIGALDTLHGEAGVSAVLALLPAGDCVPLPLGW